jgi:hypothetical protein
MMNASISCLGETIHTCTQSHPAFTLLTSFIRGSYDYRRVEEDGDAAYYNFTTALLMCECLQINAGMSMNP